MKRSSFLKSLAAAALFPTSVLASGVKKYPIPKTLTPIKKVPKDIVTIPMISGEYIHLQDIVVVGEDGFVYSASGDPGEFWFGVAMSNTDERGVVDVYTTLHMA